jgi:hypothetical protein
MAGWACDLGLIHSNSLGVPGADSTERRDCEPGTIAPEAGYLFFDPGPALPRLGDQRLPADKLAERPSWRIAG